MKPKLDQGGGALFSAALGRFSLGRHYLHTNFFLIAECK
jgi:hypothetical protein